MSFVNLCCNYPPMPLRCVHVGKGVFDKPMSNYPSDLLLLVRKFVPTACMRPVVSGGKF